LGKEKEPMPTIEERLQAIEREHQTLGQEHAQLKKTIELQTIAIGALVNKAALEKLNEKYDKILDTLMAHDRFTNEQLAELRNQHTELDGKIVGFQTEMRQRFSEQDCKIAGLDSKVASLQTEMHQCFNEQDSKVASLQTTQAEHTTLLKQILARLDQK
jgi:hypothetical protein